MSLLLNVYELMGKIGVSEIPHGEVRQYNMSLIVFIPRLLIGCHKFDKFMIKASDTRTCSIANADSRMVASAVC